MALCMAWGLPELTAYAKDFTVAGVVNGDTLAPGQALNLELVNDTLVPNLDIVEVIHGDIDLDFLARHVELDDLTSSTPSQPWPSPTAGPQPLTGSITWVPPTPPAAGDSTGNLSGTLPGHLSRPPVSPDAVEAWAGKITGSLPLGFRKIEETLVLEARWKFLDAMGNVLVAGEEVITTLGENPLAIAAVLAPDAVSWSGPSTSTLAEAIGGAQPVQRKILVDVRARLVQAGLDTGWVAVLQKPIGVNVAPLPVPNIAVAFQHHYYGGDMLVFLTKESPIALFASDVRTAVATLSEPMAVLGSFTRFTPLRSAVDKVRQKLESAPHVNVHNGNDGVMGILENFDRYEKTWGAPNWDGCISSVIVVSLSRSVIWYTGRNRTGGALTTSPSSVPGNLACLVGSLHSSSPGSVPAGCVTTQTYTVQTGLFGTGPSFQAPSQWADVTASCAWEPQ